MRSYDAGKRDELRGSDTDPSRGDMAAMTPRHPPKGKQVGKRQKTDAAYDRIQAGKQKGKGPRNGPSRALSYF